ncbi:MAG: hypothetical protein HY286_16445 [Planctomycetes bacterium]|nr:hypothetical protein [Planctomycetota bacterium]
MNLTAIRSKNRRISGAAALVAALAVQTAYTQQIPADEARPNVAAKDFVRPTVGGGSFKLSDAVKNGYVVICFIRGEW